MKTETYRFAVKTTRAPVVEIDSAAQAVYVRFKNTKVARTLDRGAASMHVAIDLDAKNEVIGVEAIGMSQFNIEFVLKQARVEVSPAMLGRVRYIPALLSPGRREDEVTEE